MPAIFQGRNILGLVGVEGAQRMTEREQMSDDARQLKVGVLGCGPIAQAAHFESCTKARNAELYAICDVADDLRERMAATHAPQKTFRRLRRRCWPIPTSTPSSSRPPTPSMCPPRLRALEAGKHVLCEKPLGVSVEEVEELRRVVERSGKVLQVGHMKRFDAGLQAAKAFIDDEMGELLALKAWYCDSTHRYAMTDAVQPLIVTSSRAREAGRRSQGRSRPLLHARAWQPPGRHGALFRRRDRRGRGAARRALRRLLLVRRRRLRQRRARPSRPDGRGPHGLARGLPDLRRATAASSARPTIPGIYKSSEVDIFHEATARRRGVLGADGHFYRRQLEGFADRHPRMARR